MHIDFAPVHKREINYEQFATQYSLDDLRVATNESIDALLSLLADLTDADVTFDPIDPNANDPYAVKGEEEIGWSIAHLIAHVTSSSEEGAAFSSMLARGYPLKERPRYETPWRDIITRAQCMQRLEESRRMRLAYLNTWPDEPFLDVFRPMSERFEARFGRMNAVGAFLFGLSHEVGHYDQIRDVRKQAIASRS